MDVLASRSLVCQSVHHPGVAVEVEDDGRVCCEQANPLVVAETVRMLAWVNQLEQVHAVDIADLELWEVLKKQVDGGQCLVSADITTRSHDQIGVLSNICAELGPDANTLCAVLNSCIHVEVLKMILFIGYDDVDIV